MEPHKTRLSYSSEIDLIRNKNPEPERSPPTASKEHRLHSLPVFCISVIMTKTVEVNSDAICYWWRWMAVFAAIGVVFWLGSYIQDQAPSAAFHTMILSLFLASLFLAFIHRPSSYQVILRDNELAVAHAASGRVKRTFPLDDLRYVTVRNTGHLFNLSVLQIVVRTSNGSTFFGPVYRNGIDGVTSAEIGRLLPRIERPTFSHSKSS